MMQTGETKAVGDLLRDWRKMRRLSQLDLALEADVSTRHLSFVETGRANPSREMLLNLAEQLDLPLRERNRLLVAGGFAPVFSEKPFGDKSLAAAREAVDLVLRGHEPFPAVAIDRHWNLVAANRAVAPLLAGIASDLLEPPANVLRISLHPEGLTPRILNFREWREHLLARLRRQIEQIADAQLAALFAELSEYPMPKRIETERRSAQIKDYGGVVIPFRLETERGTLSFISTTTVFGTPVDVTLSELAIESFFPADAETAEILRRTETTE